MKSLALALLLLATPAIAQGNEQKTAALVERLKADPAALSILLRQMPKGGDLHRHAAGAHLAEPTARSAPALPASPSPFAPAT